MCRAGGRRCPGSLAKGKACGPKSAPRPHRTQAQQRAKQRAQKFYGRNTVETRALVESLPEEFTGGREKTRSDFVETTDNVEVLRLAEADKASVRAGLAKNPLASSEFLIRAESDVPAVQAALLQNPNVRPEFLAAKAAEFPQTTTNAPATPDDALAGLVEAGSPRVRADAVLALAKRGADLDRFSDNSSAKVRSMIAARTGDPVLRDAFLTDSATVVRERALLNDSVTAPLPKLLASDSSVKIRALAAQKATAEDRALLRALAADEDGMVAAAAHANKHCPDDAFRPPTSHPEARPDISSLIRNPSATASDLAYAYGSPSATSADRIALAQHPFAPTDMQVRHFEVLPAPVREYLASESDSAPLLTKLASKSGLRALVAANPFTPVEVLRKLVGSAVPDVSRLAKENLAGR